MRNIATEKVMVVVKRERCVNYTESTLVPPARHIPWRKGRAAIAGPVSHKESCPLG